MHKWLPVGLAFKKIKENREKSFKENKNCIMGGHCCGEMIPLHMAAEKEVYTIPTSYYQKPT